MVFLKKSDILKLLSQSVLFSAGIDILVQKLEKNRGGFVFKIQTGKK